MAADSIGEGHANTAATQAAVDQQSNVDLAATNSLGETWRQRNHRRHLRNGDYRRQRWQVMPMRWRLAGRLLWGLLDRAAGGWPGRRRRGCRRGRRGRGGGGVVVVVDGIALVLDGILPVPWSPWISSMMP